MFDLPQMRRLRPRKRMWLIHHHISHKGQEGAQSPGLLTSVLCGPPCSHTPLGKEGGNACPGKSEAFAEAPAVIKAVSSLPCQTPPRCQNRDLGRDRYMGPVIHQKQRKDGWGKGFEHPLQDVKEVTWLYFKGP